MFWGLAGQKRAQPFKCSRANLTNELRSDKSEPCTENLNGKHMSVGGYTLLKIMRTIMAQMIAHLSCEGQELLRGFFEDAELPKVEDLRFELPAETLEARWEMFGEPRFWRGFDSLCTFRCFQMFSLFCLCLSVCVKRIL